MGLLQGLLPIIEKKNNAQSIIAKSKDEIRLFLNETAKVERLASKTVNAQHSQLLQLEPIPSELFDIYQYGEKYSIDYDGSPNILRLLSVGSLFIMGEEEGEEQEVDLEAMKRAKVTPYALDIDQYRERRRQLNSIVISSQSSLSSTSNIATDSIMSETNTAATQDSVTTNSAQVDEEYTSITQDVNNMIESLLGPNSVNDDMEVEQSTDTVAPPTSNVNSAATTETVLPTPVAAQIPYIPTEFECPPGIAVQPAVRASTEITVPKVVAAEDSETDPETEAALERRAESTVEPVSVPTTEPAIESAVAPPATQSTTVAIPTAEDEWIQDNDITPVQELSTLASIGKKVYSFSEKMIPTYPTLEQQTECDKITEAPNIRTNMFFNMHFEKSISILNFPISDLDYTLEEQWGLSGKLMVLKRLLNNLLGTDMILLIVAKDLGEEETLMELIADVLQLDCVRINYILQDWDGEYGVFVKTKSQVDQQRGTAERGSNFEPEADFIISMDIRISSDKDVFKLVSMRGSEDKKVSPPAAWFISVGSVEERAFNFLLDHQIPFSASKSDAFKELIRRANTWPDNQSKSVEELNVRVANNIKSWLLSSNRKSTQYQFRATMQLPRSIVLGSTKAKVPVAESTNANGTTSDMDIESDTESLPNVPESPILSTLGTEFINNNLFPPFDISTGEVKAVNTEQLLSALPVSDLRALNTLPRNIKSEYLIEINKLKRQYETAFEELQQQFREKAFSSIRK